MSPTWLLSAVITGLFAFIGAALPAQDHVRDQERESHVKFDSHDRAAAREWYNEHRENLPQGLREEDRMTPEEESRLQKGATLDPDARRRMRPAPIDLLRRLPPPARHYRYAIVEDHILIVEDRTWNISDIIHLHQDPGQG